MVGEVPSRIEFREVVAPSYMFYVTADVGMERNAVLGPLPASMLSKVKFRRMRMSGKSGQAIHKLQTKNGSP